MADGRWPNAQPPSERQLYSPELFEVAAILGAPPVLRELDEVFAAAELRHVRGQRVDLAVHIRRDVEVPVRLVRTPEEDLAHLVGLEALRQVLGEVEVIARGRVHGVERRGSRRTVVRVIDEAVADDDV